MSIKTKSNQYVKNLDFQELDSIKSEINSKIKDINCLLKSAQDKGLSISVSNSTIVIDDSLLTERHYSLVKINFSIQL